MKIYLDMDGVLADFNGGVEKYCSIPLIDQSVRTGQQTKELWKAVQQVDHFYDRLEMLPGALELFELAYQTEGCECELLTGIPLPTGKLKTAAEDKAAWAHRLLAPDLKVNAVFRREKIKFCTGRDCILVDDLASSIEAWNQAGGIGILYRNPQQAYRDLKDAIEGRE